MAKIFPLRPAKPELICWGCDHYCPANAMICGNGSDRSQHPYELFGEGWESFGLNAQNQPPADSAPAASGAAPAPDAPDPPDGGAGPDAHPQA